jgi:outer membrane protein TolC
VQTEVLIHLAEAHNPGLARLRQQRERDEEMLALADLGYWPDVTLGLEWTYTDPRDPFKPPINPETNKRPAYNRQSEGGDDNWAVSVQFDIPLWIQKVEAARREMRMKLLATDHELRGARNLVAFRILDTWTRVQAKQQTQQLLDTALIPKARQAYEVSLAGYQAGDIAFLTVMDNWRRWLEFEQMRHRTLTELETAFSQLQQEVGLELLRAKPASTSPPGEDAP